MQTLSLIRILSKSWLDKKKYPLTAEILSCFLNRMFSFSFNLWKEMVWFVCWYEWIVDCARFLLLFDKEYANVDFHDQERHYAPHPPPPVAHVIQQNEWKGDTIKKEIWRKFRNEKMELRFPLCWLCWCLILFLQQFGQCKKLKLKRFCFVQLKSLDALSHGNFSLRNK